MCGLYLELLLLQQRLSLRLHWQQLLRPLLQWLLLLHLQPHRLLFQQLLFKFHRFLL